MYRNVWTTLAAFACAVVVGACDEPRPTEPRLTAPSFAKGGGDPGVAALVAEVRQLAVAQRIRP